MSDFVSNIYGIWATKYNSLEMARAHSEVKAYGMQACYGDSYFSTLNEDYLKWVNIFNSRN